MDKMRELENRYNETLANVDLNNLQEVRNERIKEIIIALDEIKRQSFETISDLLVGTARLDDGRFANRNNVEYDINQIAQMTSSANNLSDKIYDSIHSLSIERTNRLSEEWDNLLNEGLENININDLNEVGYSTLRNIIDRLETLSSMVASAKESGELSDDVYDNSLMNNFADEYIEKIQNIINVIRVEESLKTEQALNRMHRITDINGQRTLIDNQIRLLEIQIENETNRLAGPIASEVIRQDINFNINDMKTRIERLKLALETYDLEESQLRSEIDIFKNGGSLNISEPTEENEEEKTQEDEKINKEIVKTEATNDKSDIINIYSAAKEIQRLNPNAEIRVGNMGVDPQANNRIYSSVPVEELILPEGFYYNEKNGITNKHNTKSGLYCNIDVEDLSLADENMLMPKEVKEKEEKNDKSAPYDLSENEGALDAEYEEVEEDKDDKVKITEIKNPSNKLLSKVKELWKKIPGWIKKTAAVVLAVATLAGIVRGCEKTKEPAIKDENPHKQEEVIDDEQITTDDVLNDNGVEIEDEEKDKEPEQCPGGVCPTPSKPNTGGGEGGTIPNKPSTPDNPNTPDTPDIPDTPTTPEEPVIPEVEPDAEEKRYLKQDNGEINNFDDSQNQGPWEYVNVNKDGTKEVLTADGKEYLLDDDENVLASEQADENIGRDVKIDGENYLEIPEENLDKIEVEKPEEIEKTGEEDVITPSEDAPEFTFDEIPNEISEDFLNELLGTGRSL